MMYARTCEDREGEEVLPGHLPLRTWPGSSYASA